MPNGSRLRPGSAKAKGIDREALLWSWRTAAREAGLVFPKPEKDRFVPRGYLDPRRELELSTRLSVNGARDHLSERRAVFSLSDLERETLARGREHGVTIDEVRKESPHGTTSWSPTARTRSSRGSRRRRRSRTSVRSSPRRARPWPGRDDPLERRRPRPGEDQRRVARHILASLDRIVGRRGKGRHREEHDTRLRARRS